LAVSKADRLMGKIIRNASRVSYRGGWCNIDS